MKPIGLHADHFHHLTAACDQFRQALAVCISERTRFRPNAFGEQGNSLSVERVGLGEPPDGTGKIPDLTRIDDGYWQIGTGQSGGHGDLEPAGSLKRDQCWRQFAQLADQVFKAFLIALDYEGLAGREYMNIKAIFRDIDTDEARRSGKVFHDPSLRMRARLAAQATVRVPYGTDGRGTTLLLGLSHPRGLRAPVHRYDRRVLRVRQWQDTRWQQHQSFGRSRGGFSTKIHLKTDLDGNPLDFHLTGGEASDSTEFETSLDIGPDIRPRVAITDEGYDSQTNRAAALVRGITPVIPRRENSKQRGRFFPKRLYKLRARIEQTIGKLKRFKRVAMRCEKTDISYSAIISFACTLILVKSVHTA